jgi:hypothetical protein
MQTANEPSVNERGRHVYLWDLSVDVSISEGNQFFAYARVDLRDTGLRGKDELLVR